MSNYRIDPETKALIFEEVPETKIAKLKKELEEEKKRRKDQELFNKKLLERIERIESAVKL